jgi:hypothetical protein
VQASELREGAPLRREVERLASEWFRSRHVAEMVFLLALEPFQEPDEHRYFVAEQSGRTVEFLSAVPIYTRGGWLVEDMVRSHDAPNGTTETLLDALLTDVGDEAPITLGLAPLTGPVAPWMRVLRFIIGPLYSFEGLRAFKERLVPVAWQPVWLVVPRENALIMHVFDSARAFVGDSLLRFAVRSLARHPAGLAFALAVALIPWTLLLGGIVAFHREALLGFSPSALVAWTTFDAVLVLLLLRSAMRPRRPLLWLVTAVASFDALLSVIHMAEVGTGPTLVQASIRGVSTAAPILGALALAWASGRAPQGGFAHSPAAKSAA